MQLIRFQIQVKSGWDLLEQTWCLQHVSAADSLQISLVFKEKRCRDGGEVGEVKKRQNEGKLQGGRAGRKRSGKCRE